MPFYSQPLTQVLANINAVTPVDTDDYNDDGEWLLLESDDLSGPVLFQKLKQNWHRIVGPYPNGFALLFCQGGADSGVWLHHLGTPQARHEYLPGCHQVFSWF